MNWNETLNALEEGTIRAAEKIDGTWIVNSEVKSMILEAFKAGKLVEKNGFIDKDNPRHVEFR